MKAVDYTGQRFGRLTVLEKTEDKRGKHAWRCLCDCGKEKITSSGNLVAGHTMSCGCLRDERAFDISGQRFGYVVALKRIEREGSKGRGSNWLCKCDCGNEKVLTTSYLRSQRRPSCGCKAIYDYAGKKFGMLSVIKKAENRGKRTRWECKCDCGKTVLVDTGNLTSGASQSCGCVRTKHLGKGTRLYRIWAGIKDRCLNPKSKYRKRYHDRGITVCDEWANDFAVFQEWALSHGYEAHLEVDREDNDGNYCPENCRWVTRRVNSRNKSTVKINIEIAREIKRIATENPGIKSPRIAEILKISNSIVRGG